MADFGLSNMYLENEKLKTACGSPSYASPEMISGFEYDGLKVNLK
jgi:5'-AMP-activated protein kinase catalytic alpha subunit